MTIPHIHRLYVLFLEPRKPPKTPFWASETPWISVERPIGLENPAAGWFWFGNDHELDLWPLVGSDGPFWRFRPMAPFGPDSADGRGRTFGSVELRIRL